MTLILLLLVSGILYIFAQNIFTMANPLIFKNAIYLSELSESPEQIQERISKIDVPIRFTAPNEFIDSTYMLISQDEIILNTIFRKCNSTNLMSRLFQQILQVCASIYKTLFHQIFLRWLRVEL